MDQQTMHGVQIMIPQPSVFKLLRLAEFKFFVQRFYTMPLHVQDTQLTVGSLEGLLSLTASSHHSFQEPIQNHNG